MNSSIRSLLKTWRRPLQILVSIGLLTFIVARSNPAGLLEHLAQAPVHLMLPWIAAYVVLNNFLAALGFHLLLKRHKRRALGPLVASYFKLHVLSAVVPGRLGDLGIIYFMREKHSKGELLAAIVVDKFITLALAMSIAGIGVWFFFGWINACIMAAALVTVCISLLLMLSRHTSKLRRWIGDYMRKRFSLSFDGFRAELARTVRDPWALLGNTILTLVRMALAAVSCVVILGWFGATTDVWSMMLVTTVGQVANLLPITFMGMGVVEGVNSELMLRLGIPRDLSLGFMLSSRAIDISILILIYLIWMRGILRRARKDSGQLTE